jgi:hypothetical protein
MNKKPNNPTFENATHLLRCAHAIGISRFDYTMRCHILKNMKDGRVKILVFGNRYWKGRSHINRVRYVPKHRVTNIK